MSLLFELIIFNISRKVGCVYLLGSPYGGDSNGCPEHLILCGNDDYLK